MTTVATYWPRSLGRPYTTEEEQRFAHQILGGDCEHTQLGMRDLRALITALRFGVPADTLVKQLPGICIRCMGDIYVLGTGHIRQARNLWEEALTAEPDRLRKLLGDIQGLFPEAGRWVSVEADEFVLPSREQLQAAEKRRGHTELQARELECGQQWALATPERPLYPHPVDGIWARPDFLPWRIGTLNEARVRHLGRALALTE